MDEATFTRLAMCWRDSAMRSCKACGGDSMLADDVAQDVLVKLWSMHDELERYDSVERLAAVMARHLTIDNHRSRHLVALTDDTARTLLASTANPQEQLETLDDEAWLKRRMQQLPSLQHSVLRLRQVEHRTYAEIAALLGIEESSARTLLSRARKTLLDEFKRKQRNEK